MSVAAEEIVGRTGASHGTIPRKGKHISWTGEGVCESCDAETDLGHRG